MCNAIAIKLYAKIRNQRDSYEQRIDDLNYLLSGVSASRLNEDSIIEAKSRAQVLTAVAKDLTTILDYVVKED